MPALPMDSISSIGKAAVKQAKPTQAQKIERYSLYWVDFDPTQGSEINKTRPAVVVSPDAMNKRIETVVVCPLTSQLHPSWASRVQCECAGRASEIAVDQFRTISKSRLKQQIGKIDSATAMQLREAIALLYATE
jgi:mRNA interferase MazF